MKTIVLLSASMFMTSCIGVYVGRGEMGESTEPGVYCSIDTVPGNFEAIKTDCVANVHYTQGEAFNVKRNRQLVGSGEQWRARADD